MSQAGVAPPTALQGTGAASRLSLLATGQREPRHNHQITSFIVPANSPLTTFLQSDQAAALLLAIALEQRCDLSIMASKAMWEVDPETRSKVS